MTDIQVQPEKSGVISQCDLVGFELMLFESNVSTASYTTEIT